MICENCFSCSLLHQWQRKIYTDCAYDFKLLKLCFLCTTTIGSSSILKKLVLEKRTIANLKTDFFKIVDKSFQNIDVFAVTWKQLVKMLWS